MNKQTMNTQSMKYDIRLIELNEFDFDNLIFSDVVEKKISNDKTYKQSKVYYKHDEETYGPVIFPLSKKLSFGVQPNNVDKDGNLMVQDGVPMTTPTAYKAPLVMVNKEPRPEDQEEVDFLDGLKQHIQDWAVEHKKDLGRAKKSDDTVRDMVSEVMYRKEDDDEASPILYCELMYYKQNQKMNTIFYGPGDKQVDPRKYNSTCLIEPNIRFDCLNITPKAISIKLRMYDAVVEPLRKGGPMKRLAKKNEAELEDDENDDDTVHTDLVVDEVEEKSDDGFFD